MNKGAWQRDYGYRPRDVEDAVDPGVHPAVAKMRLHAASQPRTLHDAMAGRTPEKILGQNRCPAFDLGKTLTDPSYNPKSFFKQATSLGVNPLAELTKGDTVELPSKSEVVKDADERKKSCSSADSQGGKKKKKKKKSKKKQRKLKSKKKKQSSSTPSDSDSGKNVGGLSMPLQLAGSTIVLDSDIESQQGAMPGQEEGCPTEAEREPLHIEDPGADTAASADVMSCPKGHSLRRYAIGKATSDHNNHRCDICRTKSKSIGAKTIYRCRECDYDVCVQCHSKMISSCDKGDAVQRGEHEPSEAVDVHKLQASLDEGLQSPALASEPCEHPLKCSQALGTFLKRSRSPDHDLQEPCQSQSQLPDADLRSNPTHESDLGTKGPENKKARKKTKESERQATVIRPTSFCGSW